MPDSLSASQKFRQILFRSILMPIVVMIIMAGALIYQVQSLINAARLVEHTDEVLSNIYKTHSAMVDMQAASRGFVLFKQEFDVDRFQRSLEESETFLEELGRLTTDRDDAQRLVAKIHALRIAYIESAEKTMRERERADAPPATYGSGRSVMDQIVGHLRDFARQEETLRYERNVKAQQFARWTIWGGGLLTLGIGTLLAWLSRAQLRDLAGAYEGALSQTRDMAATLERRVEDRTQQLSAANGQLNEANKELEAFAYSISHDLRAPMRHITGFANLMRMSAGDKLSADDTENLDTIYKTAVLAGRMVDDLLSFSRVGRTQLRTSPIDMNQVFRDCQSSLEMDTRGKNIQWVVESLRPTVGDVALIRMVVQNLLANAVKYSSTREEPRIEVGSKSENDGTTYWIKDNGVGFDMAYAHKLFGVFQRLHRAEEFEGTGIGLANVRRIILRHGGQVWAEGQPGVGSTFSFHLPDQPPQQERSTSESA